jgi:hypothetical protein
MSHLEDQPRIIIETIPRAEVIFSGGDAYYFCCESFLSTTLIGASMTPEEHGAFPPSLSAGISQYY